MSEIDKLYVIDCLQEIKQSPEIIEKRYEAEQITGDFNLNTEIFDIKPNKDCMNSMPKNIDKCNKGGLLEYTGKGTNIQPKCQSTEIIWNNGG